MLKCSRCGDYYIPGYLDCRCRTTSHQSSQYDLEQSVLPSNNAFAVTVPIDDAKPTPVAVPSPNSSTNSPLSAGQSEPRQNPQQGMEVTC